MNCETCKFWDSKLNLSSRLGECRKESPKNGMWDRGHYIASWPETECSDCCGDRKDPLHSPRHQYLAGELAWVWLDSFTFARVRKVAYIKDEKIYTLDPGQLDSGWPNYRPYDASLLGDPIAEWPEETL